MLKMSNVVKDFPRRVHYSKQEHHYHKYNEDSILNILIYKHNEGYYFLNDHLHRNVYISPVTDLKKIIVVVF